MSLNIINGDNTQTITLPNSLTKIGQSAFNGWGTTLIVPKNSYAEQYCKDNNYEYRYTDGNGPGGSEPGETLIEIGDFVIEHDGKGEGTVVGYKGPGGNVTIPEGWDGGKVTAIVDRLSSGDSSKAVNKITDLTIPASVKEIGEYAFNECAALTSVKILGDDVNIGLWAFGECPVLASVQITGNNVNIGDLAFDLCHAIKRLEISGDNITIDEEAFYGCGASGLTIPGKNVVIGIKAFAGSALRSVTITGSVVSLGSRAFWRSLLTTIRIPGTVKRIGDEVFSGCTNLGVAVIEEGVTVIGANVFAGCSVGSIALPASLTEIDPDAFTDCSATMIVPEGSTAEKFCEDNNIPHKPAESEALSKISFIDVQYGDAVPLSTYTLRWEDVPGATEYHATIICEGKGRIYKQDSTSRDMSFSTEFGWVKAEQEVYITVLACKYNAETDAHTYIAEGNIMLHPDGSSDPNPGSDGTVICDPATVTLTPKESIRFRNNVMKEGSTPWKYVISPYSQGDCHEEMVSLECKVRLLCSTRLEPVYCV